MSWRENALCAIRKVDPELFSLHPADPIPLIVAQTCRECTVRTDCAAEALDKDEPTGVWGGVKIGSWAWKRRLSAEAGLL